MALVLHAGMFRNLELRAVFESTRKQVAKQLTEWEPNALLNTPEADVIETLVDAGSIACPRLRRDEAWMPEPTETTRTVPMFGDMVDQRVTRLTLVVPYDGEQGVFFYRASTYGPSAPEVTHLDKDELHIVVDGPAGDGTAVRSAFDAQLDRLEEILSWSRADIDQHNREIAAAVPDMVRRRREELLAARNLQAEIGFPIRRRREAETFAVPIKRRVIRAVQRTAAGRIDRPFKPEPAMVTADYLAALAVLRNARNALERSPSTTAKLGEEDIRNVLLVNLNSHFEGAAGGELFNGDGKTDILIRVEDRNIFIGECKIWGGPSTMDDALGQLFSYLVWRDTKAAVLLFIRNKNVTAAIEKAIEKIEAHPYFKRRESPPAEDEYAFVVHAQDDPEREIHLALLPFALRTP